jgi:DNA polymerase (family 10)
LAVGGLAWPNELLSQLDFVVASVHNNLKDPKEKMTTRIISALENPYVSILGHPTCRLVSSRPPSEVDWDAVFKVAARGGKIMEINANPERLDLPEDLVKVAKGFDLKFVISSDAHSVPEQDLMSYGLEVAQRAGLAASSVVNTWNYEMLKDYLKEIKRR